jgi:hypothetical protein
MDQPIFLPADLLTLAISWLTIVYHACKAAVKTRQIFFILKKLQIQFSLQPD